MSLMPLMQELKLSITHLRGKVVKVVAKAGRQRLIDLQLSGDTWVGRALPRMTGRDCVELVGVLNHMAIYGWQVEVGPMRVDRKVPIRFVCRTDRQGDEPLVIQPAPIEWRYVEDLIKNLIYVMASRSGLAARPN